MIHVARTWLEAAVAIILSSAWLGAVAVAENPIEPAGTSAMPLDAVVVPYVYDMDVYLVRGNGSEPRKYLEAEFLREFENSWGAEVSEYDAYQSVHIDSGQTQLVAARAVEGRRRRIPGDRSRYRLVSVDLATKSEAVLLSSRRGEQLRCPQWSPDGARVAFWEGGKTGNSSISVLTVETGAVRRVLDVEPFFDNCMRRYARWMDDDHLAITSSGVWLVDTRRMSSEELLEDPLHVGLQPYRLYSFEQASLLPPEVIRALWGSRENPRAAPLWSPDRRSYFYYLVKEGFFARAWVERYDLSTKERSRIKTVWWAPYKE